MNILETIIAAKVEEVKKCKERVSIAQIQKGPYFNSPCLSLVQNLLKEDATGIIAEFKRRSPSKGVINGTASVADVVKAYSAHGACGISVLTDQQFFGGHDNDVLEARAIVKVPILRKEFVIDEYQLLEAKAMGASVILLIAACLAPKRVMQLAQFAKNLGLEVLLEIHNNEELVHVCDEVDLVGVNNRNLKTFTVNVQQSIDLADKIPAGKIKISESGINDVRTISRLQAYGYKGFLIGENFMKQTEPSIAFADFVHQLKAMHNAD